MRTAFLSVVVTLFSSYAWAGSVETTLPVISPVTTPDSVGIGPAWDGFYGGGLVAFETGEQTYFSGAGGSNGPHDLEGITYGAFLGYSFQRGELVYGAEAAYALGEVPSDVPSTFGANYSSFVDLKARAGYAVGDALIYGVLGGSLGVWEDRTGPPETASTSGMNYGLGIDYQITDQFFLGAEYLVRDLSGEFDEPSDVSIETINQSAQIRVGLRF